MQDRFKFRLYDKAIDEMVYDVCIGFIKDSGKTDDWVCADTSCGQITYRDDKLKDIVLMQCTGLKDKNGKLIYEGDIVNGHCGVYWMKMLVIWDEISAAFYFKKLDKKGKLLPFVSGSTFVEIIGNIYENPELLENKQ